MDVRAFLVIMLLAFTMKESWCQRSHYAEKIPFSQGGKFSPSGSPPLHDQISKMAQSNPDMYLIRSKLGAQAKPYSLSLSPGDYHHYLPKPKRLRTTRLMKILGSSYDPFWMSLEDPRGRNTSLNELGILSLDLAEHTARFRKKLLQEAKGLDLSGLLSSKGSTPLNLSQSFIDHLQQWLVDSATCHLTSSWVDMGSIFWPRWVRHTDCDLNNARCSWPPGMTCQPAQVTYIKLLAWHCWVSRDQTLSLRKSLQQCTWRQIPYPVVAACKCSC